MAADQDEQQLVRLLNARMARLEAARQPWLDTARKIKRYVAPTLGRFDTTPNDHARGDGDARRRAIIDETATTALRRFTAGMSAGMSSPSRPWFRFTLPDRSEGDDEAQAWLDDVTSRVLRVLAQSNFYRAVSIQYAEIGAFGTCAMVVQEDREDVVRFYPLTFGEYCVANDDRLDATSLYRRFPMTAEQLADRFDGAASIPQVQSLLLSGGSDQELIVCHAYFRNSRAGAGGAGPDGWPWRSVYWLQTLEQRVLEDRTIPEKPFCAARWEVCSTDAYGSGPGWEALGSVIQLQAQQLKKGQAIEKSVNPPLVADISLSNQQRNLAPGGITFTPNFAAGGIRSAYDVRLDIGDLRLDIADVQQRIEKAFYTDLWLMISQLDTVRTATEIAERKEEKMLMLGPALESIHAELLSPALIRTVAIMDRARLLPPLPPSLRGRGLRIDYVSIMAQAQKAVATTAIERTLSFAGGIAGIVPTVMDGLDPDEAVREYAQLLGAPQRILVPPDVVAKTRAAREQAARQQQAAATGMAAVQAARTLSQTETGGGQNALQSMFGMGGG